MQNSPMVLHERIRTLMDVMYTIIIDGGGGNVEQMFITSIYDKCSLRIIALPSSNISSINKPLLQYYAPFHIIHIYANVNFIFDKILLALFFFFFFFIIFLRNARQHSQSAVEEIRNPPLFQPLIDRSPLNKVSLV